MSLYKYVIPERIDVLENGYVRFSQPSALNDPFEMQPYFESIAKDSYFKEELNKSRDNMLDTALKDVYSKLPIEIKQVVSFEMLKQLIDEHPEEVEHLIQSSIHQTLDIVKEFMPIAREQFYAAMDKNIGVFCLTEKRDNRLMWSHYSQSHQGFVIEFDEKHPYFHQQRSDVDEFGYLRKVEYRDERPDFAELIEMSATDMFLVKGKEWEYEQEWRMLRPLKDSGKKISSEYGDIHLFSIAPECITGVIFGLKMSELNKNKLADFLAKDERYNHIKKYQAVPSDRKYELDIIDSEI